MAERKLKAVLLREGDTFLWLPPEADDLASYRVRKVHFSDPETGKLRIETDRGELTNISATRLMRVINWNGTGS